MVLTLLMAIVFVVLTMFLFLQDWRSTLIPAVTIPVSLVGTFFFVKLMGFSINTLTLFGITLATGLVVDDAIVVIENVKRHMGEEHISAHAATSEAMGEVTGAVVATSLVLIAVFVPVGFFPGTTGLLYQQFSLTIAFSIALSAFNSLTFTPALSALVLEGEKESKSGFFGRVEAALKRLTAGYTVSLRHALDRRLPLITVFLLGLGATGVALPGGPPVLRPRRGLRVVHRQRAVAGGGLPRLHDPRAGQPWRPRSPGRETSPAPCAWAASASAGRAPTGASSSST